VKEFLHEVPVMKARSKHATKKLVLASLISALICAATALIKLPSPLGYIHPGDAPVVLAAFLMSPTYGFLAAAIGSCLADVFSGYALYAPVTFLIKGGMVLVIYGVQRVLAKSNKTLTVQIVATLLAEMLMVLGYYLFEGCLYGFGAALAAVPFNVLQGLVGMSLGILLVRVLGRSRVLDRFDVFEKDLK
jgi:uncharacterized membrane protein